MSGYNLAPFKYSQKDIMVKRLNGLLLSLPVLFGISGYAAQGASAASFDCTKASSLDEKAICYDSVLSALDEQLAAVYKLSLVAARAEIDKSILISHQKEWLRLRRQCVQADCLNPFIRERIEWLEDFASYLIENPDEAYWPRGVNAGLEQTLPRQKLILPTETVVTVTQPPLATPTPNPPPADAQQRMPRPRDSTFARKLSGCAAFYNLLLDEGQRKGLPKIDLQQIFKRYEYNLVLATMFSDPDFALLEKGRFVDSGQAKQMFVDFIGNHERCQQLAETAYEITSDEQLYQESKREFNNAITEATRGQ